jgi:hypothetical protein
VSVASRWALRSGASAALAALLLWSAPARALEHCEPVRQPLDGVRLEGLSATAADTVTDLLPRSPPAIYARQELGEFERRLGNLGIFDAVAVDCEGRVLRVVVREKWTLVPEVDFATGKTLTDTYALLGVTEYNLFGTANQLSISAYREQRGFGIGIGFDEHDYKRRGWSLAADLSIATAALRFEGGGSWRTASAGIEVMARSPPLLHEYFNYIAGFYASNESVYRVRAVAAPPSSRLAQSFMGFSWDSYEWNDLVPSGLQTSAWLIIGGIAGGGTPKPRHGAEYLLLAALPLAQRTVLMLRLESAIGTRGNVNYSYSLGSVAGVRGLRDATYFTWAQAFSNLELRQSFPLWPRWALQLVGFSDAAAFEQLTADGRRGDRKLALSLGLGARVIPTWISSIVFRFDASRLLEPETAWFAQFGLAQYF